MYYIEKLKGHLKTVCKHKYFVFLNCCKAGIPLQGITHDLSKFLPTELFESVKYYQGNRSPIDACKEINGISKAWLHHKGNNPHHYEYWQDNFDNGGIPLALPFKYALELVCDYLAAGMAYQGENFTYSQEYEWWQNKCKRPIAMHSQTKLFVEMMLLKMKLDNSNDVLSKKKAQEIFERTQEMIKRNAENQ